MSACSVIVYFVLRKKQIALLPKYVECTIQRRDETLPLEFLSECGRTALLFCSASTGSKLWWWVKKEVQTETASRRVIAMLFSPKIDESISPLNLFLVIRPT